MTTRSRVFISHSAHPVDEPATQKFLTALVKAIDATPDLQALADQKGLQAGDAWLQQLYAWMGLCDAAVILLSPRALLRSNATWVPRETNLLLWRKALDPRFVVIPVLIGGLQPDDLQGHPFIADARLADLQLAPGLTDLQKRSRIVRALHDKLASGTQRRVFDAVHALVEHCLQHNAPQASVSATLARHYTSDTWLPYQQPHQNLSHKMVRQAVSDTVDPVIHDASAGSLGTADLGATLFQALYPLRLPADAACQLLALCRQQEGRGSVLVNSRDSWVVHMLLRAATGLPTHDFQRTWRALELTDQSGEDDLAEVTQALAEELARAVLGPTGWATLSDKTDPAARLAEQLARLGRQLVAARKESGAPILICAAYTPRWLTLASALVQRFPGIVFVFWTGDELPQVVALAALASPSPPEQTQPAGATGATSATSTSIDYSLLSPSWPPGTDLDWLLDYNRKLQHFGGTSA